jgi:hypothetical protein
LECEDYNNSLEADVEYVLDGRFNKSIKCWGKEEKNILQFSLVLRLGFGYSINHSFIDTYPNNSSVNKRKNPKSFVHG